MSIWFGATIIRMSKCLFVAKRIHVTIFCSLVNLCLELANKCSERFSMGLHGKVMSVIFWSVYQIAPKCFLLVSAHGTFFYTHEKCFLVHQCKNLFHLALHMKKMFHLWKRHFSHSPWNIEIKKNFFTHLDTWKKKSSLSLADEKIFFTPMKKVFFSLGLTQQENFFFFTWLNTLAQNMKKNVSHVKKMLFHSSWNKKVKTFSLIFTHDKRYFLTQLNTWKKSFTHEKKIFHPCLFQSVWHVERKFFNRLDT